MRSKPSKGFAFPISEDYYSRMTLMLEVDLPDDLARLKLPKAVGDRLQRLLDRQDAGEKLSAQEMEEASGLVEMAEFLSLLRLRRQRTAP